VRERLASLGDPAAATEGRLVHWRDTSGAVLDFPMLGTGLGTYRYANLPYQRHQGDAWYVNADNHYFEMLVETGVIGLVLYLFGFAATGLAAGYLMRSDRLELRTAGIVGMFITASQAVQALTDFGLLIPANALTFAVLSGSVCGAACRAANAQRLHVPWRLGIARLEGRWSQAMLPFVLTSASFAFGLELYAAMRAASAGNVLIEIDPSGPLETRPERLEAAIEQAEHALDIRPDDPELHRAVALWWIDRYRLEAARELDRTADPSAKLVGRRLWQATSVGVLSSRALELREEGDGEQLGRLRELPIVREYLIPARDHLLEASWHGPLTRDVSRYLADLTFLSEDSDNSDTDNWAAEMSVDLARALFVTPSSPDRLYDAAIQAEMAGLTPLSDRAFGRCLEISDEYISSVWSIVSEDRPIDELLDRVIPDRLEVLVTLAEQNSDELVKSSLANHASRLLNEGQWENVEEPSRLLQARLAELQGKSEQAIRHYRVASGRQATEIEARFRLARLLLEEGRLEEAESELSLLHRMAENRKDVKSRLDDLKQEWRDTLPHDGE